MVSSSTSLVCFFFFSFFAQQTEFRDYNELLRHAVSLGRRLQDPLAEFCYLAQDDNELLCLKFHELQVSPEPWSIFSIISVVRFGHFSGSEDRSCLLHSLFPH